MVRVRLLPALTAVGLVVPTPCGSSLNEHPRFQVRKGFTVETAASASATKERGRITILIDSSNNVIHETRKGLHREGNHLHGPTPNSRFKKSDILEAMIWPSKPTIKARRKSGVSIMPEGLLDGYTQAHIAALVAFLQAGPPKAGASK